MVVAPAGTTATWLNAGLTTRPAGCRRVISMGSPSHRPLTLTAGRARGPQTASGSARVRHVADREAPQNLEDDGGRAVGGVVHVREEVVAGDRAAQVGDAADGQERHP